MLLATPFRCAVRCPLLSGRSGFQFPVWISLFTVSVLDRVSSTMLFIEPFWGGQALQGCCREWGHCWFADAVGLLYKADAIFTARAPVEISCELLLLFLVVVVLLAPREGQPSPVTSCDHISDIWIPWIHNPSNLISYEILSCMGPKQFNSLINSWDYDQVVEGVKLSLKTMYVCTYIFFQVL